MRRPPARAPRRRVPALTNDPASLFQPPQAVGPYRVRRVLASGTLGPRLLVEDARGRLQVLKLITDLGADAPALAERLDGMRRALPLRAGLLPISDVGISDEGVYLASPVVDAPTVEGRLRGGRQTLDATLPWLRPVVAGLQAAHDARLWHGAIHPRDILVGDEGGVLTGVGIAPALEALGAQAPVRVPYTAPERASGRPWDARADQYSLAMLALDALSGRRLIAGTIPAFDRWTLAETPAEDARLHDVFVRALDPDPGARFASVADWLKALAGDAPVAPEDELSRFAREGVILAPPAAAATAVADIPHEIEVQALEGDGVALSLFPEEDGDQTVTAPVVAETPEAARLAPEPPLDTDEDPDQEWLVAALPEPAAADDEDDDPFGRLPARVPSDHPPIDAPSMAQADVPAWSLDDQDTHDPSPVRPISLGPSWDEPSDDSRRGPWLVMFVLLVLAGVGYGTWRSLQTSAGSAAEPTSAAAGTGTDAPAPQVPESARRSTASPARPPAPDTSAPPAASPSATPRVVPQAPRPSQAGPGVTPAPEGPPSREERGRQAAGPQPPSAAPRPAAPAFGRALIRSSPSGEVRVNGRVRGQTPVVLRDLPFGTYVVTISRPGFETAERQLTVLPSQPVASITVDLVRSTPGGAAGPPRPGPGAVMQHRRMSLPEPPRAARAGAHVPATLAQESE